MLTLSEYKTLTGVDSTYTLDDAQISALITPVSSLIKAYTDRSFVVTTGTATSRVFQYDGSGFLDIDDCTNVTAVTTDASVPGQTYELLTDEWTAMPHGGPVVYYLMIHGGPFGGVSREMGFERNLDTMDFVPNRLSLMTVTATWGWPAIPDDVKLAAAWTIQDILKKPSSDGLTAEAIEGYSRSWGGRSGSGAVSLAIPNRARDILINYQRQEI